MNPLADRMRPKKLEEIIGQTHILAPQRILFKAIKNNQIFSMIFWGPPGVGKTTLARVIASEVNADFLEFSAVNTSMSDIKKIMENLTKQQALQKTIIFIDEIHRFNKSQQDSLLPYVETGIITLIGATTENPSFEIIGALLSRCRVFTLSHLSVEELEEVINRSLKDKVNGLGAYKIKFEKGAKEFLIETSGGDSRILLNALETAVSIGLINSKANKVVLSKDLIEEALQRKALMYDKAGEEHYNTVSAFIKSMRASNIDASLYYLARMVDAGEDPLFIARRMVIFSSEDIGMAVPTALVIANEVFRAVETIGYPECQINLAHGVAYLANAKKDRSCYEAYFKALDDVRKFGNLDIPLNLRNAPTKLMKDLNYGKDYKQYTKEDLLPEQLKGKKYYTPKD